MKKNYFLGLMLLLSGLAIKAQDTATFESFSLPVDTFVNRANMSAGGGAGFFASPIIGTSDSVYLANYYDTSFGGFWSGFSLSTMTDTTTSGFMNQYSVVSGSGLNNSLTYLTYYQGGTSDFGLTTRLSPISLAGSVIQGFYINNSTYTYLSMRDGDAFAKKFGDTTGGSDGKDWFKLTVKGDVSNDSVEFYLADFRSNDTNDHYILNDWTYVDLSALGAVNDSLFFKLSSSDNSFGYMNTPGYFCMDNPNFYSFPGVGIEELISINATIYPNPTTDYIHIKLEDQLIDATIEILSISGQLVSRTASIVSNQTVVDVRDLPKGNYVLNVYTKGKTFQKQFVKQ